VRRSCLCAAQATFGGGFSEYHAQLKQRLADAERLYATAPDVPPAPAAAAAGAAAAGDAGAAGAAE
jgi:hypothetical protein